MDELICTLSQRYIVCMNDIIINHFMYADDTCIIALSPSALQDLFDMYGDFAVSNWIILNEERTKCMCFKPNSPNGLIVPTVCLNDTPLPFVTSNIYLAVIKHDKH